MKPLKIFKPFKYFNITQKWNNPNPIYGQFGFTHHNGIDCTSSYNDATTAYNPKIWPVWCPVEGFTVQLIRWMPNGGGHEMWLISDDILQIGDKQCRAYIVLAHGDKILVPVGYKPVLGELIMMADNTGFSTGSHTHIGLYRVNYEGAKFTYLDSNDANNSYSPEPFLQDEFALDKLDKATLIKSALRYAAYYLGVK